MGLVNTIWICHKHETLNCKQCAGKDSGYFYTLRSDKDDTEFHKNSKSVADLVVSKQAAYGNSFGKSGQIMRILYPQGIKGEQLNDALTIVRIVDKLFRIATSRDAFKEDPWRDINGYSLLAVVRNEKIKSEGNNI